MSSSPTVKWSEDGEPYLPLPNGYTLTPIRETDASQWVKLKNEPTVAQWRLFELEDWDLPKAQKDISETLDRSAEALQALKQGRRSRLTPFHVIRSPAGDVVGTALLLDPIDTSVIEEKDRHYFYHPNIGWSLSPEHTGRGIASAAARALLDYCRDHVEDPIICGGCNAQNKPSTAMFKRLGFEHVQTFSGPLGQLAHFDGLWWILRLRPDNNAP